MAKTGMKAMAVLVVCVLLAGCAEIQEAPLRQASFTRQASASPAAPAFTAASAPLESSLSPSPTPSPTPEPQPVEIDVMAVGDIMFQYGEIVSAYDQLAKRYDFNSCFQFVRDILGSADLTLGNFECTLGGPPYSQDGKLRFSAPDAAADAVKAAGFDVLSTANNHAYDKGTAGILRTLQVLGGEGLACVGTRPSADSKPYAIVDVKGIKIGVTAYTFCDRPGGGVAIHGYRLDKEAEGLVNVFSNSTIPQDLAAIGGVVQRMREDGAEIVLLYMHWGTEYTRNPDGNQLKLAQGLADAGVDVVIGSHPHWMQTVDTLTGKDGGKTVVAYSLGNFISTQMAGKTGVGYNFKYSQDGMALNLRIEKKPGGTAEVSQVEYLPTWTFIRSAGGQLAYTVVPLERAIASPAAYGMNAKGDLAGAKASLADTQKLLAGAVAKGILSPMELD